MAYGGGTFTTQNKVLPGTYINFINKYTSSISTSERGYCTMPLNLDWGYEDGIFTVDVNTFEKNSLTLFGYDYTHDKLKGLRDLFLGANTLYAYRLNGGGAKASNTYATAKYGGTRGNDITISITKDVDIPTNYIVKTYLDGEEMDTQTVTEIAELIDNDWVTFITTATLAETAGEPLSGGTNGTVTGASYKTYLDKIERYAFNTMGVRTTDDTVKELVVSFCKRLREESGAKFQVVLYNKLADYEGVISVKNSVTSDSDNDKDSLVFYVTGASCGCAINESLVNTTYNGEFIIETDYTQTELEEAIGNGEFVFHYVSEDEINVLKDINTFISYDEDKGEAFSSNQTMRILDTMAIDIANIFNKTYLGKKLNNEFERTMLKSDIVAYHEELENLGCIEDFDSSDITVSLGDTKESVVITDAITVINAMEKLYMTVVVN